MTQEQVKAFIKMMQSEMILAGELAISSQSSVKNIGKTEEVFEADTEVIKKRKEAKTIIDEKIQEQLLLALYNLFGDGITIDAEEDTPSKKLFSNKNTNVSVVIDPIDGTLEYLKGSDKYNICVCLLDSGKVVTALVYFPVRKLFYFISHDDKAYVSHVENRKLVKSVELVTPHSVTSKILYCNVLVPQEKVIRLKSVGYQIISDGDGKVVWPDAFLNCMQGEYKAVMLVNPQIRDILLGAIIEKMMGGYAVDFTNTPILWPRSGRIPAIVFGFHDYVNHQNS